jgi:hypothetical protein
MRNEIIVICILLLLFFTTGCTLQSPEDNPTYSVLPEMLLDYDFQSQETKIWVKSAISDFKYDSIIIELMLNESKIINQDNNTYCIFTITKSINFNITINVFFKERVFQYQASILVQFDEEIISITIFEPIDESEEIVFEDDLPFKKVLEELEE